MSTKDDEVTLMLMGIVAVLGIIVEEASYKDQEFKKRFINKLYGVINETMETTPAAGLAPIRHLIFLLEENPLQ